MNAVLAPFRIIILGISMLFFTLLTALLLIVTMRRTDFVIMFVARTLWSNFVIWICGIKLKIHGKENFDKENYYIYIVNHSSFLDIPITVNAIPVPLYFFLKQELRKSPFVGWYSRAVGMIFVDRKNKEKAQASLKRAGELIKNGKNVMVYPEGTRSPDGQLIQFRKGAFAVSKVAGIGIVPIAIEGTNKVLAKGAWIINPGTVHVNVGKPVPYSEIEHMNTMEMANHFQGIIQKLKKEVEE